MHISNLDTPALLLDIEKLERNIKDIIRFAEEAGVNYRPHLKTHKSIHIAKWQMELGAVGVTVATVGEAEVMAAGGINDILIAFPISSRKKLTRIKQLTKKAKLTLTIDSQEQADMVHDIFKEHNQPLAVWIKVNSGLNRVGVEPNEEVVDLAKYINELPSLALGGIFTHAGHAYGAKSFTELEKIARDEANAVLQSAALCEAEGIKITHKSIGSTPTFKIAGAVEGITEIRPGNAAFYDMTQFSLGVAEKDQCALTVLTTVCSKKQDRLIIDAGSKTLALDQGAHGVASIKGFGYIKEFPELVIERLSEEHGVIGLEGDVNVKLNDKLTIIPNHACVVANLFDQYVVHRNGNVMEEWKVDARGKLQ